MVALERKRKTATSNGVSKRLKAVATSSLVLHSYSRLPDLNELPTAKTQHLDVFVWGSGSMCELGLGPAASTKEVKRPRLNPLLSSAKLGEGVSIVDFAAGGMHTLALDSKGRIWSWGGNDSGVLGRDTSTAKAVLKEMTTNPDEEDDEDGDLNEAESIPGLVENLPTVGKIVRLAATDNLSAALYENGDVYAWGCFRCNEGMLGFLRDEIKLQPTPLKIKEFKNIVQLAAGKDHLLALDSKGIVFAWGNGQQFQLGRRILERHRYSSLEPQQFGLYNVKYIASGDFHCFAIDQEGKVFAWGLNQFGQCAITDENGELEDGSTIGKPTVVSALADKDIVEIVAGEHHTLALTKSGEVLSWGRYDMKEIGISKERLPEGSFKDEHGNVRSVPIPTKVQFGAKADNGVKIKTIGVGSHHSFAVTDDGVVYAWGFADTYAPGLGPLDEDVAVPTRIVNTATKFYDIQEIGAGGQFSISGGVKIEDEETAEDRNDKYEEIDG